jgi:hypothetical protein
MTERLSEEAVYHNLQGIMPSPLRSTLILSRFSAQR